MSCAVQSGAGQAWAVRSQKAERAGDVDVFRLHVVHHLDAMAVNQER